MDSWIWCADRNRQVLVRSIGDMARRNNAHSVARLIDPLQREHSLIG